MPAHCCRYGCNSRQEKGSTLKFFRIPKDADLQAMWVSAIKREYWTPTEHTRICCKHFIKGRFYNVVIKMLAKQEYFLFVQSKLNLLLTGCPSRDTTDFVPSLFSHTPAFKKDQTSLSMKIDRHQRLSSRKENNNRREAARALIDLFNVKENEVPGMSTQTEAKTYCDAETQTDIDKVLLQNILCTNRQLKDMYEIANEMCKKNFKNGLHTISLM
ncbi:THAP domain-containing protein 1-like [Pecten maximus]|uniref:THAP domain-containing protein 1-like n=1 Tax=Pecten maximus TaxID=6579 RepID=UPI0014584C13|nr:THAP domain-containing protein 1-like [Pecten maximus]